MTSGAAVQLFVHVGSPKTGTSYLQAIMQEAGAACGVTMLPARRVDAFWMMQDLRGRLDPELDEPAAFRALDQFRSDLAAIVASGEPATVLLSEEQLGAADPAQVQRLLDTCGDPADAEVHVVVTSRALSRALPAYWQQQLQVGARLTFEDYCEQVRGHHGWAGPRFWLAWDVTSMLERWTPLVPRSRFHVVTVPRDGAPEELLQRFCRAMGVTVRSIDGAHRPRNPSLGWAQAEVLRRVNVELPDHLRHRRAYRIDGKEWLGLKHLAAQGGDLIALPVGWQPWCVEQTARVVDGLKDVDVIGDLNDLRVEPADFTHDEWMPSDAALGEAAVQALASIVEERSTSRAAHTRPHPVEEDRRPARVAARKARAAMRKAKEALRDVRPGGASQA